jgi:replicative superfamily II helicase
MSSIGLMLVDEIHLLNEAIRGATLEGLMSRCLLRQQEAIPQEINGRAGEPISRLRIIGLSATAPNAGDVAEWSVLAEAAQSCFSTTGSISHCFVWRCCLSCPCQG